MASTFRCEKCDAEYYVLQSETAPDTEPTCVDCGATFVARDGDSFMHYVPTRYVSD